VIQIAYDHQKALMSPKITYRFSAVIWQHASSGGWFFVSIPKDLSEEIRTYFQRQEEGWGRMKASARIGNTEWATAIWFDTKRMSYLLPLKAEVRKKEGLENGMKIEVILFI
jgi:hypothetical protein